MLDNVDPGIGAVGEVVTLNGFLFQSGACFDWIAFGGVESPSATVIDLATATAVVPSLPGGVYDVVISCSGLVSNPISFTIPAGFFARGDCNQDGTFDISDAVSTLAALFILGTPEPPCVDACDVNDDGGFDVSDAVYGLASLFITGSPVPVTPGFPDCGPDPSDDLLECLTPPDPCP